MNANTKPTALDPKYVVRSYRGRSGCMCGCRGTYSTQNARAVRVLRELEDAAKRGAALEVGEDLDGHPYVAADLESGHTAVVYLAK